MIKVEKHFDGKYELTNTIDGITYYFGQFNNMDQVNFEIDYRNKTGWKINPPERLKWNHLPRYIYYHKNKKKLRVDKWETHRTRHYGAYNTLDEALAKRNKLLTELLENKR